MLTWNVLQTSRRNARRLTWAPGARFAEEHDDDETNARHTSMQQLALIHNNNAPPQLERFTPQRLRQSATAEGMTDDTHKQCNTMQTHTTVTTIMNTTTV